MWRNVRGAAVALNAMFQFLVIYRYRYHCFIKYDDIYILDVFCLFTMNDSMWMPYKRLCFIMKGLFIECPKGIGQRLINA